MTRSKGCVASWLWVSALAAVVVGCATSHAIGRKLTEKTIEFPSYSVGVPSGDDWGVQLDQQAEVVEFGRSRPDPLQVSGLICVSSIKVFKIPSSEGAPTGEQAIADDYRANQEQIMVTRGVKAGLYGLEDVKKGTETVGGKKVYSMRYSKGGYFGGTDWMHEDSVFFLWFPPDFEQRMAFFGFMATETYGKGKPIMLSSDLSQLDALVASFAAR
jgi:hypothetical protein